MKTYNRYRDFVLGNAPRVLSNLDRNEDSETYGCFDRNFWNYKIRDFPSMILQQGGLALALLYLNNFKGNVYYKNEKVKDWAIASTKFWLKYQHRDGSFDEYYPNEHGFPPVVFSLFSTAQIMKLLKIRDDDLLNGIRRSVRFLRKNKEEGAVNQEVASLAALYASFMITGDKRTGKICNEKIENLIDKQSDEGWLPEYGGVDFGYLTVSLNYLAEYYKMSNDHRALEALKKMIEFISYFVHPDGTIGGNYGSRNTQYVLPNGFEIVGKRYDLAKNVVDKIDFLKSIDDRYILHYIFPSFVSALVNYTPRRKSIALPRKGTKYFKEGGLIVSNEKGKYSVISLSKGGVIKTFKGKEEIFNDAGYVCNVGGKIYVTNWPYPYERSVSKNKFFVSGNMMSVKQIIPNVKTHVALRTASITFGKNIIPVLKKQVITRHSPSKIKFERDIIFEKNKIIINDVIDSPFKIDKISSTEHSFRYVPSSRYFLESELNNKNNKIVIDDFYKIRINRVFDINKKKLSHFVTEESE